MPIHPDKTAHRAVDACGGTYTPAQEASGYALGHKVALTDACEAVKKPDALMAELLYACKDMAEAFEALAEDNAIDLTERCDCFDDYLGHCSDICAQSGCVELRVRLARAAIAKATGAE